MAASHNWRLFIGGTFAEGATKFAKVNPATGKVLANVPNCTQAQTDQAIAAAKEAIKPWGKLACKDRAPYFEKAAEAIKGATTELAELLTQEQGKPLGMATWEVGASVQAFQKAAALEIPTKVVSEDDKFRVEVRHNPVGVVAGIVPWNFPLMIAVSKIAKALAYGNSVVVKPSPFTPVTALKVAELLEGVFPAGTLSVLTAEDVKGEWNLGAYLTSHPDIRKVSFTGSVATGKAVLAGSVGNCTRTTLELGGNDAAIVREDADVKASAKGVLTAAMANSGQICVAIKRAYVHEKIYDEFVDEVVALAGAKSKEVGNGLLDGVSMGPLNNKMQLDRVAELVEDARTHPECKVLTGGKAPAPSDQAPAEGFFYEPTIVTGIKEGVRLVDEEQFGPVLPVMKYSDDEEAIERANATCYGLAGSVWGGDAAKTNALAARMESGTVWVNEHLGATGSTPFGGYKMSGIGREGDWDAEDLNAFTETQTIKLVVPPAGVAA